MSRVYVRSRENIMNIFLISVHKHMHTPEYQRPVALTHTTDLLGSPYEYPVCTHLCSRASYRSPSPITCEFIRRSRLWAEFNLYGTCPSARVKPKKWKRGRAQDFFFPIVTHCPLDEVSAEKFQSPKCPFNLLESCLETFVGEKCLYFLY